MERHILQKWRKHLERDCQSNDYLAYIIFPPTEDCGVSQSGWLPPVSCPGWGGQLEAWIGPGAENLQLRLSVTK